MEEFDLEYNLDYANFLVDGKNRFTAKKDILNEIENMNFTQFNIEQQEKLKNELNLDNYNKYIYDVDIPEEILSLYKVGESLYQPTEIYTTTLISKPERNCRFLIYSKIFHEFPKEGLISEYKDKQLAISSIINSFKIIDIITINNITQITLLQYDGYEELVINHYEKELQEDLSKKSREIFENSFNLDSIKLDDLNEDIELGIGIGFENEISLYDIDTYKKDQNLFILDLLSDLIEYGGLEKLATFLSEIDIGYIARVYKDIVDELKQDCLRNNTDFNEAKKEIIELYKKDIIETMELTQTDDEIINIHELDNISQSELEKISKEFDISIDELKETYNSLIEK